MNLRYVWLVAFFAQQVVVNVLQTTQVGLVPDLVPEEKHGFAGGATAANTLAGALAACAIMQLLSGWEYHVMYGVMAALNAVCCALVCAIADEESSLGISPQERTPGRTWLGEIMGHYYLDIRRHTSFFIFLLTKTLYCATLVGKGFLLYFFQDPFRLGNRAG